MGIHFTNAFRADIAEEDWIPNDLSATIALIATQITISEEIVVQDLLIQMHSTPEAMLHQLIHSHLTILFSAYLGS